MPIHEIYLVLDEVCQVEHDVGIVQEDLVVGQGVNDRDESGVSEERLAVVGGGLEVYGRGLRVELLELVE